MKKYLLLLLAGCSFSGIAFAQQAPNRPYDTLTLEETVVSATRWETAKKQLPVRVISLSTKQLRLQNPQTAADMLGLTDEVFIQKSQQAGGSPMIRGFATNRLLYVVDGVRMNTAIFRAGNIQNVISLDPLALEKTEVMFGPGSVMYGSDAIGGVMSFRTLTPEISTGKISTKGKAIMRYSSANNEKTAHFDVRVGGRKWGFVSSFSSSDFGDLRMGSHGPEEYLRKFYVVRQNGQDVVVANEDPQRQRPSGYKQINLMQKVRWQPSDHWDIQYGFHYSDIAEYPRYDRLYRTKNGQPVSAEWNYGPQTWLMNSLNIKHTGATLLWNQASLTLAQQRFEESRIDRGMNKTTRAIREETVKALSLNLDLRKYFGKNNELLYGAEAVLNDVQSVGTDVDITTDSAYAGPSRYPQATWKSLAAYATYLHHLSDHLTVQAGGRYNQYGLSADFSNNLPFYPFPFSTGSFAKGALTGTIGAAFSPNQNWTIRANVASAFRSPNVDDFGKVFDSEPGAVVVPNPDLQAEKAISGEIGVTGTIGKFIKVDITGYYTLVNDALVRRDFTLNGQDSILYDGQMSQVQAIQNAAQTTVWGIQAGVEIKLPAGLLLTSRCNYQKGVEELDNGTSSPAMNTPPAYGSTRLSFTQERLTMQVYALYNAQVSYENLAQDGRETAYLYATDANGNPYSPSWYTLNIKALYEVDTHFSVSAGVENLTDQRYRPYRSGIVAAGRNLVIAVNMQF